MGKTMYRLHLTCIAPLSAAHRSRRERFPAVCRAESQPEHCESTSSGCQGACYLMRSDLSVPYHIDFLLTPCALCIPCRCVLLHTPPYIFVLLRGYCVESYIPQPIIVIQEQSDTNRLPRVRPGLECSAWKYEHTSTLRLQRLWRH